MKNTNKLMLAAVAAVSLVVANRAFAGIDDVGSPKIQSQRASTYVAPASGRVDPDLVRGQLYLAGSPKVQSSRQTFGNFGEQQNDRNLVAEQHSLNGSPKIQSQQPAPQFEIAPLK